MDLVTIARFSSYFDAHVIKGRLEAEDIVCFLTDEHQVTINPMYDIALGGIKLKVAENDVELAKEILKTTSYNDSGSISGFNVINKVKQESSALRILLLIILAVLIFLSA